MSSQPSPTAARQIVWPSVVTVISAAILIGAEVFGAAFAGGWALAILFGLDDTGAHILQAVLFATRRLHHGGVHPRRAARRAVYAARVSRLTQQSRAPPASNAYASLKKLNVCSLSTPLARAERGAASTR